jgi:hypothetical protein
MDDDTPPTSQSVRYDHPSFVLNGQPFVPFIYDAGLDEQPPAGFNAVRIPLDGRSTSDLDWSRAREVAERLSVDQAYSILWDIDLGLFSRLGAPFSDTAQFHALRLSLKHFAETLWPAFSKNTLGIVVYRGLADFSQFFPWNSERQDAFDRWLHEVNAPKEMDRRFLAQLFCRDCCSEYLHRLTAGLPGDLLPWLLLDAATIQAVPTLLELTHRDCWARFVLALKGPTQSPLGLGWDTPSSFGYLARTPLVVPPEQIPTTGLLLPGRDEVSLAATSGLQRALQWLTEQGKPYRVLTEDLLTAEWDHLHIVVGIADCIGPLTQRKLQGFRAAGGEVILIDT